MVRRTARSGQTGHPENRGRHNNAISIRQDQRKNRFTLDVRLLRSSGLRYRFLLPLLGLSRDNILSSNFEKVRELNYPQYRQRLGDKKREAKEIFETYKHLEDQQPSRSA
jgi:hypothetical protein